MLADSLRALNARLDSAEPVVRLFGDGLDAYRTRLLHESRLGRIRQEVLAKISADTELRFPHRKILDFLLAEYDYAKDDFKEIHFSHLVRECRVGKSKAPGYLSVLEQKGLVVRRDGGYRVFFRIRA